MTNQVFVSTVGRALVGVAFLLAPAIAQGQGGNGFTFGQPHATFTLRGGLAQPSASSDIFSFTREMLTVNRGSFAGGSLAGELGIRLLPRLDLQVGASFAGRQVDSHFRDFTDTDDQEIEQSTTFRRIPVTAGLKFHLREPGRRLSQLVWIPAKWTPYVGAGGGVMHYRFKQEGDFVDFRDMAVFPMTLESSGWTTTYYANAGIDYSLNAKVGLVSELRYDMGRAPLSLDFEGYDRIDLSGVSATVGFSFRF